jgi:GR25 family glycosyltransferase involved in LPS biosynthesis
LKRFVFLIFFIGVGALYGSIEDWFKPVDDKPGPHSFGPIDFIYVINLDQRPEKWADCFDQLNPYGIFPCRFSAVNGWELPLEKINILGIEYAQGMKPGLKGTYYSDAGKRCDEIMREGQRYFCHGLSPGAIGIILSHLSVLQDAFDNGYETVWVMEDDIAVINNPLILCDLIAELDAVVGKNEWDIFFTDRDTKGRDGNYVKCRSYAPRPNFTPSDVKKFGCEPIKIAPNIQQIFARYGSYSMIIRRSGIKKLLDFFKRYQLFLPYDMDFYLPEDIKLYGVFDDVVSTKPDALSDNGKPGYRHK